MKNNEVYEKIADCFTSLATYFRSLSENKEMSVAVPKVTVISEEPIKEEKSSSSKSSEVTSNIDIADVRKVLADKTQNGKSSEVKALLIKFGGSKLSDINPENYSALIEEAKKI